MCRLIDKRLVFGLEHTTHLEKCWQGLVSNGPPLHPAQNSVQLAYMV